MSAAARSHARPRQPKAPVARSQGTLVRCPCIGRTGPKRWCCGSWCRWAVPRRQRGRAAARQVSRWQQLSACAGNGRCKPVLLVAQLCMRERFSYNTGAERQVPAAANAWHAQRVDAGCQQGERCMQSVPHLVHSKPVVLDRTRLSCCITAWMDHRGATAGCSDGDMRCQRGDAAAAIQSVFANKEQQDGERPCRQEGSRNC